jgi:epoxide hydrolase-like predicted phosphatase
MSKRLIAWDLGGVLLRTENYAPREALARQLGMTRLELEQLVFDSPSGAQAMRGEISIQTHWENIRLQLQKAPEEMEAIQAAFWGGDHLDLELITYIRSLKPKFHTALLSNAFSDLRQVLERWEIADAFEELVISAEVGLTKPDARIYRLLLERFRVAPANAIFVDDFPHNVEGARLTGMFAIHFQNPAQARQELEAWLSRQN